MSKLLALAVLAAVMSIGPIAGAPASAGLSSASDAEPIHSGAVIERKKRCQHP